MRTPNVWVEQQFKAMGRRDAHDLAFARGVLRRDGTAHERVRDPELLIREGRRLERGLTRSRDPKAAAVD